MILKNMIFYENVQTRFFARPKIITEKKDFFCIVERNFIVLIIVCTRCQPLRVIKEALRSLIKLPACLARIEHI